MGMVLNRLTLGKVSHNLYENVHFNANNPASSLRHIEVTDDKVLLEFAEANDEYKKHANLMFASDDERKDMGVPEWLVPVDLKNRTYCGGGATIFLDKTKVVEHFRPRKKLAQETQSANVGREDHNEETTCKFTINRD